MLSILKTIIGGAVNLVPKLFGNKAAKERYQAMAQSSAMQQYAAEFRAFDRTWLDILVDSINRLIRPTIVAHVIVSFWYLVISPEGFGILMAKLALAPQWYTYIVMGVILFWFGQRPVEKFINTKFDKEKFKEGMNVVKDMEKNFDLEKEMDDTSKPLSNRAILEWNERQKK